MKKNEILTMDSPVTGIHGVGAQTAAQLENIGVSTVKDLLFYLPRRYERFEMPETSAVSAYHAALGVTENMNQIGDSSGKSSGASPSTNNDAALSSVSGKAFRALPGTDESPFVVLKLRIISKPTIYRAKKLDIVSATAETPEKERVMLRWYRMPYLLKTLWEGKEIVVRGHLNVQKNGSFLMEHPSMYEEQAYRKLTVTLQPVYPATANISAKTIRRIIENAFEKDEIRERICEERSEEFLKEHHFPSLAEALTAIHFPEDGKMLERAHKRLAFEEFYTFLKNVWELKTRKEQSKNLYQIPYPIRLEAVIDSLPFKLTEGQLSAVREIIEDLGSPYIMSRLLQGDVGSGKTIVAFLTMAAVTGEGYQCALMAPTEVLARQHYEKLLAFDEKYHLDLKPVLLTGSMTASHKKREIELIADGTYHVVVGTHALFQEKVRFHSLAYCITD
ncbi:MAG: DEAD/DEAH box helicase, partial [Lachnospiraceae bacterium]|nr:DEAD/DEAH box helicase [Lachnospiraceae bacterium]